MKSELVSVLFILLSCISMLSVAIGSAFQFSTNELLIFIGDGIVFALLAIATRE